MTLPISGALSLFNLQGEFGGTDPIGLAEYYRGGGIVDAGALTGTGSFQTVPLTPTSPVPIPSSGTVQISQFYGTRSVIVGNTGIVVGVAPSDTSPDYIEVTLPAGVDLIRIFLVGAGGGGGGKNAISGGDGGAGSTVSGTINTSWAGPTNVDRKLRFFIGRGGARGVSDVGGNSISSPAAIGGHGYSMNGVMSTGSWGAFLNNYGVTWDQTGGIYQSSNAASVRSIYFPTTGTYTFTFAADNYVSILIDGVLVANTSGMNDQGNNNGGSFSIASGVTKTVTVSQGYHKIRMLYTNTGSIGAYGVRIVDNSTSIQVWSTRDEYSTYRAYPTGGNGGYAGNYGSSGYGGAGGSATFLSIVNGFGNEYFVALAGGGGGGGGAGDVNLYNVSPNANWMTQGWSTSIFSPNKTAGGEGEFPGMIANNSVSAGYVDGGGGGGGGGGIANDRQYVIASNRQWIVSGLGGRVRHAGLPGLATGGDFGTDGGESGKSAITSSATRYADVMHVPSTSRSVRLPTNPSGLAPAVLASLNTQGGGGIGSVGASPSTAGANGVAYVDWGLTGASVLAPSVTRAPLRAGIVMFQQYELSQYSSYGLSSIYFAEGGGKETFLLDAFGGGGNPASEYSYSWTNIAGTASISSPNSYRTNVTGVNSAGSSGTVRCTVTDASANTAVADFSWYCVQADDPAVPITCFTAGSMVVMGDGTLQPIETISAGAMVMGANGPTKVVKVETPWLGLRKLCRFPDGHTWSAEHSHWTRDSSVSQWWWAADADAWRAEVQMDAIGGLTDNSSMRTGEGFEYAHLDGWKTQEYEEFWAPENTKLYLPLTEGSPIIVDGYLVGAGLDQSKFDYNTMDWDVISEAVKFAMTRVSSVPPVADAPQDLPEPHPPEWEPPPVTPTFDVLPPPTEP